MMKKILLADDDADDREIFEKVLANKNDVALVRGVENGIEVIRYLDDLTEGLFLPDLIVLDHNMPMMNGMETLEILKSNPRYKDVAVVIYTTYSDTRMKEKCLGMGAVLVLTKPSTMREYETAIDQFLEVT